ncbi:NAD(P)-dependent oxidoreductase [Rhizobium deserti]|uniref:NAD(P)-dependent oxidoreductase n=1 Tax=Rhizobium deserti TaxID=2547961 RepID=A0A4R5UPB8_9HYPH|nr:NAD(P)-dependent oxidoreductase [Rhizobium deserti]TDK39792.1 NAD(P)-dependent oxidoreductase [Rhizobium deserti]
MRVLVSGGTGFVGRYIVEGLLTAGYQVVIGGRRPPAPDLFDRPVGFVPLFLDPDLDQSHAFETVKFFVHAAFDHVPGRYRGGEGTDPQQFRRLNLDGTVRLFETAKRAGVQRAVFLSSRAVYDGLPLGTKLSEDLRLCPNSLYGEIKLGAEQEIAALSEPRFITASLRATGIYGDLQPNKWDELLSDFLSGKPVLSRAGTEVHGRDLAAAVRLMLESDGQEIGGQSFNLSDVTTDTREILQHLHHPEGLLPPVADRQSINVMPVDKIRGLGWQPGGQPLLARTVENLGRKLSAAV